MGGETVADNPQMTFGVKPTVQEAAVVLIKDVKNARPGPSIYRVKVFKKIFPFFCFANLFMTLIEL